ncbi:glycoside hydrolase family 105 protein [Paenibacillus sp. TAF43_2]|uniref:glycoside hydrolase family 88/105 protein n=1 Tax=Paenibacillus sp. TAF43_2 TaxID=3233069 RepID=UPI003F99F780
MSGSPLNLKMIKIKAELIYEYMTNDSSLEWGMDIGHWDWVPGVGVISILRYYERTNDPKIMEYLINWTRAHRDKSEHVKVINGMAPYAIYPALYRYTGDPYYLDAAKQIGNWMLVEAPRTREGAFEHTVTEKAAFPEQVWADTIFMAVLFLARLAKQTRNTAYAEEALNQTRLHLRLLQDQDTGVLFHGWNCAEGNHMSAARWTRANAWVAVGVPEILSELEGWAEIPADIVQSYQRLIEGLVKYQAANGLWHTVMDQSSFYFEASGSAGIACGIIRGINQGLLDESLRPYAIRSTEALIDHTYDNGQVLSISGGTPVMPTIQAYNDIELITTLYGQGLALMLFSEWL